MNSRFEMLYGLLVSTALVLQLAIASSLVQNSGFEEGVSLTEGTRRGPFSVWISSANVDVANCAYAAYGGGSCMGGGQNYAYLPSTSDYVSQSLSVQSGKQYILLFSYRGSSTSFTVSIGSYSVTTPTPSASWNAFQTTFTATETGVVSFVITNTNSTPLNIDNIYLIPSSGSGAAMWY